MIRSSHFVVAALAAVLLAHGCDSDGEAASTSTASGGGGSGGAMDPTPAESCVRPGDKGNEKGVGRAATPRALGAGHVAFRLA